MSILRRLPEFEPSLSFSDLASLGVSLLKGGAWRSGRVAEFEEAFAQYIGVSHAVMVPSARMGTYMILDGLGLSRDDEVILPALTHYSIPAIAVYRGLKPVFVDIERETCLLNVDLVESAITERTKAIVPTHLYGLPCDMDAVLAIASKHGLKVIEDCAQSCGADYQGRKTGSLGDAAYFTFGPTKNFTTLAGGIVATNDSKLAEHVRAQIAQLKAPGLIKGAKLTILGTGMTTVTKKWVYSLALFPVVWSFDRLGRDLIHNLFLEEERLFTSLPMRQGCVDLFAELGLRQLRKIDSLNAARNRNGTKLIELLQGIEGVVTPSLREGRTHIFASFPIQAPNRDRLASSLVRKGIATAKGYMSACPDLDIFAEHRRDCPVAKEAAESFLHLPVYGSLTEKDLDRIAQAIRSSIGQ